MKQQIFIIKINYEHIIQFVEFKSQKFKFHENAFVEYANQDYAKIDRYFLIIKNQFDSNHVLHRIDINSNKINFAIIYLRDLSLSE